MLVPGGLVEEKHELCLERRDALQPHPLDRSE